MSYWMIVCRKCGETAWWPYNGALNWRASRDVINSEIEFMRRERRKVMSAGGHLTDLEFAPAQVRVEPAA